jgi:T5SS/PEP-CTERM-associated repeat protein
VGSELILARGAGSTSVVTVTGEDSALTLGDFVQVGARGDGTLNILDGGVVNAPGINSIGRFTGSTGEVTVSGVGSSLSTGDNTLFVGRFGAGSLTISDGGTTDTSGNLVIGAESGISGIASVSGAGSELTVGGFMQVGANGNGTLHVLDGGGQPVHPSVLPANRARMVK